MTTYKWTCLACKTPNILVHDESKEGQTSLGCRACGEPGVFEHETKKVWMHPGTTPAYASTEMLTTLDSAQSLARHGSPRIDDGWYRDD